MHEFKKLILDNNNGNSRMLLKYNIKENNFNVNNKYVLND